MTSEPYNSVITKEIASQQDIEEAISKLTQANLLRLRRFAELRIAGLGKYSKGYTWQSLLNESITRTLDGRRTWDKNAVDFIGLLIGVIRSISSHWIEESTIGTDDDEACDKANSRIELLESELLFTSSEGDILNPFDTFEAQNPDPEDSLDAKLELERIRQMFSKDLHVLDLLDGWSLEMTGREIQEASNMTKKEFEAAVKRLRRGLGIY